MQKEGNNRKLWSDEELKICVFAYFDLMQKKEAGVEVNKAQYKEKIIESKLIGRNSSAYEMRMGNISAVMELLGKPVLSGYKPMKNVGVNVTKTLIRLINDIEKTQCKTKNEAEQLMNQAHDIIKTGKLIKPENNGIPTIVEQTISRYIRDANVVAWVLNESKGVCEACEQKAPFLTKHDMPYLEVHHVLPLSKGGPDQIDNAIAVCPNCHKRLHFSFDASDLGTSLLKKIKRLNDYRLVKN